MSRKSEPTPTIDTSTSAPRRPSKRTESDETVALRALRTLRQLDEREAAAKRRFSETLDSIEGERVVLQESLTAQQAALVQAMKAATRGNGGT